MGEKKVVVVPGTQVGGSRGVRRSPEGAHQVSWVHLIWVVVGFDYQAKKFYINIIKNRSTDLGRHASRLKGGLLFPFYT